ncbi:MAG: hypothetical protein GXO86_03620, partial [Chlorobi bacterium]|nr:hypothetical protein [Chlorobiota bacterium]
VLISFWTGFVLALAIGQLWHFLLPADGRLWIIYSTLAAVGFLVSHKEVWYWIKRMAGQWKKLVLFGVLLFGLSLEVAFMASHSIPVHDTGSYHLPATLWNHAFPLVPGLSNLHSRLGFNSSLFIYSASLPEGIWASRPYIIMMGPFILMAYLLSLTGLKRIVFSSSTANLSDSRF